MLLEKITKYLNEIGALEDNPSFAVACSGGIDSLALTFLMKEAVKTLGGNITALIVNHNLREGSELEAKNLSHLLNTYEIENHILTWIPPESDANIQAKAREARYNLLIEYSIKHNILYLVTGHHFDDLIESFFLRLQRGSGLTGLSLGSERSFNGVVILKPLQSIKKEELKEYLISKKITWFEDHTNLEDKYLRNQLRHKYQELFSKTDKDLLETRIFNTIKHLERAEKTIHRCVCELLSSYVAISPLGYACVAYKEFSPESEEALLLFSYLLTIIGGKTQTPRFENLQNFIEPLSKNTNIKNYTLHGCIINIFRDKLIIMRTTGKEKIDIPLSENGNIYFDNRFKIKIISNLKDLRLTYLSKYEFQKYEQPVQKINLDMPHNLKNFLLSSVPVLKYQEKVIYITCFDFKLIECEIKCEIKFEPFYQPKFMNTIVRKSNK